MRDQNAIQVIRKTPQEEKGCDEDEGKKEFFVIHLLLVKGCRF
jgi:hypothetical protein